MPGRELADFLTFAKKLWKIYDKNGKLVPFVPNPAQTLMLHALEQQKAAGKPGRLRVLKYRQAGSSLLWSLYLLHQTIIRSGLTSLSIADKGDLPAQWLRRCKILLGQIRDGMDIGPTETASSINEIYFRELGSRYYIGSAEGTTPGMGATLQAVHNSEVASWRDPDAVLADLLPAIPPGPGTLVVQESTGRSVGDWWYQRYNEAKKGKDEEGGECEYVAIFLPWFIQPEYTDGGDITWNTFGELTEREVGVVEEGKRFAEEVKGIIDFFGVTPGQLAWRRRMLASEFHGDEHLFAQQFPANDREAFLAGGLNVFTAEQCANARKTIRKPIWTGEIWPQPNPIQYTLTENPSGELRIWERPDRKFHYVIGADVQWGQKDTSDFDACYVECLETGRMCAAMYGRWDMGRWASILAALGYYYNTARLAPERNSRAAEGVIAVLLGMSGNNWRYPNIFIRSPRLKLTDFSIKDYGWYTGEHEKPELIVYAKESSLSGEFDWGDQRAVNQMEAYIRDEHGKLTAPTGAHDDALMARMITGYVAHIERPKTDLYAEQVDLTNYDFTTPEERLWGMSVDGKKTEQEIEEREFA